MTAVRWLTTTQVGKRIGVSRPTVLAYIKRGLLRAYLMGNRYRVKESDFLAFMAASRVESASVESRE